MSLNNSPERAAAQKAVIDDFLRLGHFSTSDVPSIWTEFWESVWGVDFATLMVEEEVEREEPVAEYDPPVTTPDKTWVARIPTVLPPPWRSAGRRILVRSEYHEAEREALSADEEHWQVFTVTGHPGIGSCPSPLNDSRNLIIDQENRSFCSGFS
jgi:hypothetical protein